MPLPLLLAPVVTWIFRDLVIKFVIFTAMFAVIAFFVPYAVQWLAGFIGVGGLNSAFSAVDPGVWWWLDAFNAVAGIPLLISAYVSRFLIRRLPVIG